MKYRLFIFYFFSLQLLACKKSDLPDVGPEPNLVYKLNLVQSNGGFSPRYSGGELLFKDSLWLFGGFTPERSNEVWNSVNGVIWNQMPNAVWSPRNLMGTIEFNGKIWLMGGYASGDGSVNDIYSSLDGRTWQLETLHANWPARAAFGLIKMNNKLYVFGGLDANLAPLNDVWESVDGINWTLVTSNAPWSPRGMFGTAVFGNEIYLIAGGVYNPNYVYNVEINYKDVWKSANGLNWTQLTSSTPFSARRFLNSFVLNNRLFASSGFCLDSRIFQDTISGLLRSNLTPEQLTFYNQDRGRFYGNLNDIWSSSNGMDWQKMSLQDTFPIRHEASVIVKNNEAYWIGGFGVDLYNDVWKLKLVVQ
jgi:hypothetical protein